MQDFFSTDAGQRASMAKQYLEGALTLDAAQRVKGQILFLPTLALAGHGLELMLKACHFLNGKSPAEVKKYGHIIAKMCALDICEPIRGHVFANASWVAAEECANGAYPDSIKEAEVLPLIKEYVIALGKLHGEGDFPLRYPVDPNLEAPRTPFLVKSLWGAADDLVKRPSDFRLSNFLGKA